MPIACLGDSAKGPSLEDRMCRIESKVDELILRINSFGRFQGALIHAEDCYVEVCHKQTELEGNINQIADAVVRVEEAQEEEKNRCAALVNDVNHAEDLAIRCREQMQDVEARMDARLDVLEDRMSEWLGQEAEYQGNGKDTSDSGSASEDESDTEESDTASETGEQEKVNKRSEAANESDKNPNSFAAPSQSITGSAPLSQPLSQPAVGPSSNIPIVNIIAATPINSQESELVPTATPPAPPPSGPRRPSPPQSPGPILRSVIRSDTAPAILSTTTPAPATTTTGQGAHLGVAGAAPRSRSRSRSRHPSPAPTRRSPRFATTPMPIMAPALDAPSDSAEELSSQLTAMTEDMDMAVDK